MTEYERPNSENRWVKRFLKSESNPINDVCRMVQIGIEMGLAEDNPRSRRKLARQMGGVFSHIYVEETFDELYLEDLNLEVVAEDLGIGTERVSAVGELMVNYGFIKSREKIRKRPVPLQRIR